MRSRYRSLERSLRRPYRLAAVIGASLALVAGSVIAAVVASAQDDVVVSAVDFEDGTWNPWVQSGGPSLAVVDTADSRVLQVSNRALDFDGIESRPLGLFEPGVTYSFSLRARLGAGGPASSELRFVFVPGFVWIGNQPINADGWTTISGQFTVPDSVNQAETKVYLGTSDWFVDGVSQPYTYLVDDILITGPAAPPPPDVVVVSSVDFEDGTWDPWVQSGGPSLAVVDTADGRVLQVSNRVNDFDGIESRPLGLLEPGVTYTFSLRAQVGAGGPASTQLRFVFVPGFVWIGNDTITAGTWTTITGVFTVPDTVDPTQTKVYLGTDNWVVDGVSQPYTYLVDDILITTPSTGPQPGIIHATDFESGLNGWVPREVGASGHTVTLSTDFAHGGAQSALVSGRDSQGDGIGLDITELTQPAVSYRLTAWVRFAPGVETDAIWLSLQSITGGVSSFGTLGQFTTVTNTGFTQVTANFTPGPADTRFLYFETRFAGGDVGNTSPFYVDDIVLEIPEPPVVQPLMPLMDTVDFPFGVAVDSRETAGSPSQLLLRHFNQITPENHMKPDAWYAEDRTFRPHPEAVQIMDFAAANGLRVYGHVLVWHAQVPDWFFQNAQGAPLTTSEADKQLLRDRLRSHIENVAEWLATNYGEFGGGNPVVAFDVVNEVISDASNDPGGLRQSEWFRILGEEYIDLAFTWADEAFNNTFAAAGADDPVTLFINDYNTEQGAKQDRYRALIDRLLADGVPVGGVGHQFHLSLTTPVSSLDAALDRFADLGLPQAVTELDVTVGTPVSEARLVEQGHYYRDAFEVFRSHDLYSVTVWGLSDNRSWRSAQAPTIFDGQLQAKPAYFGIADPDNLPALQRSAFVFGGDVPLTAAGFDSVAWRQLPGLPLSSEAGSFGLRWTADHLTVLATVASDTADSVQFEYGEQVVTFGKDGTGASGVVDDTGPGWRAIVHLPHTDVSEGDTASFDLRVRAGDTVLGAWNTPGSLGTLSFVEELSYVEVNETAAAPVIDGTIDGVWADANVVHTAKRVEGSTNAQADVRTLWAGDTLYLLFEVTDPVIDVTSGNPWEQDSVEIFIDAGNAKNGAYRPEDAQMRINVNNVRSFGTGDAADQDARLTSATALTDGGYIVEAAIDLIGFGGLGTFHGVDFQVNDGSPRPGLETGARTAVHTWAEPTGTGFQTTARWGVAQLVGAPVPACTKTVNGLVLGSLKVTSGVTCLTGRALVIGKVTVSPGATLISDGGVVVGVISANGARWIDLRGGGSGPLTVTGTTQHLSVVGTLVAGAARLANNTTPGPIVVSDNTIIGLLACSGNEPPPVNNGAENTVLGVATGQCKDL